MKICTGCEEEKPLDDFYFRNREKGYRVSRCKACLSAQKAAAWASGNIKESNYAAKARRIKASQDYIWQTFLENPCADCGQTDPLVLEFDHVRGTKKADLAKMVYQNFGIQAIIDEIAKCEVVCRNCHSIRTQTRANSWRVQRLTAG